MAEKCTKTSGPPPSWAMKPKPFSALNHLTVPWGTVSPSEETSFGRRTARRPGRQIAFPLQVLTRGQGRLTNHARPLDGRAFTTQRHSQLPTGAHARTSLAGMS